MARVMKSAPGASFLDFARSPGDSCIVTAKEPLVYPHQECFALGTHHQGMHVFETLRRLRRGRNSDPRLPWKAGKNERRQHTGHKEQPIPPFMRQMLNYDPLFCLSCKRED